MVDGHPIMDRDLWVPLDRRAEMRMNRGPSLNPAAVEFQRTAAPGQAQQERIGWLQRRPSSAGVRRAFRPS
jgi:hypothetical protein